MILLLIVNYNYNYYYFIFFNNEYILLITMITIKILLQLIHLKKLFRQDTIYNSSRLKKTLSFD